MPERAWGFESPRPYHKHSKADYAVMAELADAPGSGPVARKGVGVQVPLTAPYYGVVAQLVEHRIENPGVTGSIPVSPTTQEATA